MKLIGEILIENNLITKADLEEALEMQRNQQVHKPIGEILISMGIITIQILTEYLNMQIKKYK